MARGRDSTCGDLLDFEEVRRRLQLGTRTDIGTLEIPVADVIGSVSRVHEFDGCFRPRTKRLRALLVQIRAARPDAADIPILVYQVDHAYFVVDGHKRLALAVEEGRTFIDAEIGQFASRFHVARGTTIDEIRATEMERQFREVTGLDAGVPDVRFPLADPDAYLELAESVKSHAYDLSRDEGRIIEPAEAARHWYDTVFAPAVEMARNAGVARALSSCSEPELFLTLRRGIRESMDPGWQIPPSAAERGVANLRAAAPGRVPSALARVAGLSRSKPRVLDKGDVTSERTAGSPSLIRRPRRETAPPEE